MDPASLRPEEQLRLRCIGIGACRISVGPPTMSDVSRILQQIESGDPVAAEQLLPLVYDELRELAAARLNLEKPGQTLQATALVHEAYLRIVGPEGAAAFADRQHFFAAAAEAMRRILEIRHAANSRFDTEVRGSASPNSTTILWLTVKPNKQ